MGMALMVALGVAVVALIAAYAVAVVIRYNQLSLARGLVREGWRQLELTLRDRRELVPEFRAALSAAGTESNANPAAANGAAVSPADAELARACAAESALFAVDTPRELSPTRPGRDVRSLRRKARWFRERAADLGAAERRLSIAVATLWQEAERGSDSDGARDGCAGDLYAQLDRERARIEAATRLFNHHAEAYNTRLRGPVALPLRAAFLVSPVIPDGGGPDESAVPGRTGQDPGAEAAAGSTVAGTPGSGPAASISPDSSESAA